METKSYFPRWSTVSKASVKLESISWLSFIPDLNDKIKVPWNDNSSKCRFV